MRRRYSHNKLIEPIRIRNRFSYSKPNETTDSDERVAIRSPVRSPDNDNDDMDFQYDHKDDLSFHDINDDDNAYGSINPQDYNDEMIFSQDNVNSSDTEEEEESDNEYNYEEEEEEEDNNENNDEEEEDEGNNDDNNNQVEEERNNDEEERNYDEEERNNDEEERNNDEEERNNEEEEIHQIVEALDEDKIPFCNGQFAPYFDNYTTTALFCWLQKHNVSTKAYEDLVDIIHNSQFEPTHVVKNIRRFQSWRKRLPLLPIITKSIKISPKKTPSTSRGSKPSYQLSISEIIWRVLNNPMLMKHMYFGPGINSEEKSEFWHGNLWGKSPLFGQHEILISEVLYRSGDFVYYHDDNGLKKLGRLRSILKNHDGYYQLRIQKILEYSDLPGNLKGLPRQRRSITGEVWLQDEPFLIIMTSQILEKVTILMMFQHQNIPDGSLRISEIIYKCNDRWHVRNVKLSYLHPSDYISIRNPPSSSMPIYKLFLDLYYDDFGTFRNVYHSLGGVYVQFGNMPAHQRKLIKNHFVIGFIPFGGKFDEFMIPFISEMKELEKGKVMTVQGQDAWIIAGLGVVTADLPQGNDMTGVLRHNANKGCRTCKTTKESLSAHNQDIVITLRYHHITDEEILKISHETIMSRRDQLCTEYGLRSLPSILDKLKRERHLQTPQDVYHATAGKIGRLLKLTCELFSREGEDNFIEIWKNFEIPKRWSRLPNPITHYNSFMMSDLLRLAMIMPFLLNQFLKESSIKRNETAMIQQRIDAFRVSSVPKIIISCWIHVAKTMKAVFNKKFTSDSYEELQQCLEEEFSILPKVFVNFVNLPNIHVNMHLLMHAKTFGTLINTQVGIKEMVHRIFKGMVPKTNCKNIDLDLLKRYNTLFAIRHLADGGIDPRFNRSCTGFTNSNFGQLFLNWYVTEDKYSTEATEQVQDDDDDTKIISPVNFISNISLKKRMPKQERDKLLLTLHNFKTELFLSYVDMKFEAALINSSISWYKFASYMIEEENGILSKVHLHLDDFITIYEEDHEESYAIIKGIFQHKGNNNKYYAFIVVDWFEDTMVEHSVLKCPLYRLQATGDKWRRIFPITVIDNVQKVHFIHNCNSERCQLPNHDTTNRIWIKNNFYFTAI
ncbi:hypothetical protein GLOIN_2v1790940 [Rhizophagus irregularis DAOM 181602=DAOM 197198]|uniref:BAH domain-containing protein n=3 Tax=Rhizophagus irregularis TaxID=588596 RepID=A0A2P4NY18_RHIID|nr:hypothetical protein GLOIN_2v1790940 [Rhizophagus irregularis DAOM 181602=DAOM 197198]POG58042.1 hypothetical protein GLOIN_2v1790940 [Rhizophagus irregularis DAOM 181602=DAOM 197198]|eukprot:XP_025164908.1 hypothetical protein GLOIN_2v1790940 [Rhizophagus irregularis DAOM 181602=DAOM 197198]